MAGYMNNYVFAATLFALLSGGCTTGNQDVPPKETRAAKESRLLSNEVRSMLRTFYSWPTPAVIQKHRIDVFPNRVACSHTFDRWLKLVLASSWLPPENAKPMFLKGQASTCDMIRLRWSKNGYDVQVSQTADIFAMKLTPEDGRGTGRNDEEKLATARALCLRIFAETGRRFNPRIKDYSQIKDLPQKIASFSFRKDTSERLQGNDAILIGRPRTTWEEGAQREMPVGNDADSSAWCKTLTAWGYWFRQVYWWNDGTSVGIHFQKDECGQFAGSGYGIGDEDWFEGTGATKRGKSR